MAIGNESATEFNINHGLEANRPADPLVGSVYLATDTEKMYVCYSEGIWQVASPITSDADGTLLFNGTPIIPVSSTISGTQTNPSTSGGSYFERLAGKLGYLSKATFTNPAGSGYTTPLGMRMTDADGNILDMWTGVGPNSGASIPEVILQRFTKKRASDKLYIHIYRFPSSGSCTLSYTEVAAFLKV